AAELRKVIWPTRRELRTYTIVALEFVLVMVVIVTSLDYGFTKLVFWAFGCAWAPAARRVRWHGCGHRLASGDLRAWRSAGPGGPKGPGTRCRRSAVALTPPGEWREEQSCPSPESVSAMRRRKFRPKTARLVRPTCPVNSASPKSPASPA